MIRNFGSRVESIVLRIYSESQFPGIYVILTDFISMSPSIQLKSVIMKKKKRFLLNPYINWKKCNDCSEIS